MNSLIAINKKILMRVARALSIGALLGLAVTMAACTDVVKITTEQAHKYLTDGKTPCHCDGTTLGCDLPHEGPTRKIGILEESAYCDSRLLGSKNLCSCNDGKRVCSFAPGIDGLPYESSEFDTTFPGETMTLATLEVGACDAEAVTSEAAEGSLGCFAACDPASPQCATGLECLLRDNGTAICFNAAACAAGPAAEQAATEAATETTGATECKCEGTTLVCSDGTRADFNPACGVGGGSSGTCGDTYCGVDETSDSCPADCAKP